MLIYLQLSSLAAAVTSDSIPISCRGPIHSRLSILNAPRVGAFPEPLFTSAKIVLSSLKDSHVIGSRTPSRSFDPDDEYGAIVTMVYGSNVPSDKVHPGFMYFPQVGFVVELTGYGGINYSSLHYHIQSPPVSLTSEPVKCNWAYSYSIVYSHDFSSAPAVLPQPLDASSSSSPDDSQVLHAAHLMT